VINLGQYVIDSVVTNDASVLASSFSNALTSCPFVRLSVCLCLTFVGSIETAKHIYLLPFSSLIVLAAEIHTSLRSLVALNTNAFF